MSLWDKVGQFIGTSKPKAPQVGREAIDRYERNPINYSATGGNLTSQQDVMQSLWSEHQRKNLGKNTGPVGVAERDAWLREQQKQFFSDPNQLAYAEKAAKQRNAMEIATNRTKELSNARDNAGFDTNYDTGVASRAMLEQAAVGGAPSQAEMMMNRRGGEVARNAMSMARSAREYNPALMAQAMNQGQLAGVELGGQAAEMRAQEMANARGQLLSADQAALGARGQQAGLRAQDAQLKQGAEGMLRNEYLNRDQMAQSRDMNVMNADLDRQKANAGQQAGAYAAQTGRLGALIGQGGIGGGLQGIGGMAMASDKKLKTNIKDGENAADAFMSALRPKMYEYIDKKYGAGERLGVMAQDMVQSSMGDQAVVEGQEGKMVDTRKATSALLASTARLNERLSKLEKGKKK